MEFPILLLLVCLVLTPCQAFTLQPLDTTPEQITINFDRADNEEPKSFVNNYNSILSNSFNFNDTENSSENPSEQSENPSDQSENLSDQSKKPLKPNDPSDLLDETKIEEVGKPDNVSHELEMTTSTVVNSSMSEMVTTTEQRNSSEFFTNQTSSVSIDNLTFKSTENETTAEITNTSYSDVILPALNETAVTFANAIYQQTLVWLNDSYTLSLLIPVTLGLLIASTIIVSVALCRCIRRKCYRRRLRRKILPEDVKKMRPSDMARLLAESSDDEF